MIHAYTWPTPNGRKLHIMLEECELEHEIHPIRFSEGDQFKPEFLKISPNNKIPAIVDEDGPGGEPVSIFESGAILIYLAEKTGKFLPDAAADPRGRIATLEWLMWQMGGVGPMMGQNGYFTRFAKEKVPHAIERYQNEMGRLFGVAETRLGETRYLAGDDYTIADIATFGWFNTHDMQGQSLDGLPNVSRWMEELRARPGVQRGLEILSENARRK
jgi:GST-like protein